MADLEAKEVKLIEVADIPASDDLIVGDVRRVDINLVKLAAEGTYKRGLLLMSSSDGSFVSATKDGAASATELAILADDIEIGENEYMNVHAYFGGMFKAKAVILDYETETDSHEALLEALTSKLRQQKISVI